MKQEIIKSNLEMAAERAGIKIFSFRSSDGEKLYFLKDMKGRLLFDESMDQAEALEIINSQPAKKKNREQ